jgi:hypothetical protein
MNLTRRIDQIHQNRNQRQRLNRSRKMNLPIPVTLILPERVEADRVQAQQSIVPDFKDVFKVSAWKWGIDSGSPRWRQLFFKWLFLPFLSLSFKLGIPTPKEVVVESDEHGNTRRIYRWFEDEGIFEHEDQADAGCLDEHWGYTPLPYGRLMPPGSGQYGGTTFPRKQKGARKWSKPKFPFVIKNRTELEHKDQTLAEALSHLNQVLDRR